jgi:hypothetical protein
MPIDLTQIKKKILPPQDGQDELKLRVGTVAAIDSAGLVTLTLNGVAVPGVPSLSGAAFAVGTVVQVLSYRGSLLIIGAGNSASAQPVEATGSTANGTTNSASFVNTLASTGTHGVVFIAPPSGKIQVLARCVAGSPNAGSYSYMDYEIRQGSSIASGTLIRSSNSNTAAVHQSPTANAQSTLHASYLFSGLTPGAVYNAYLTYLSTHTTAPGSSFNRRQIAVYPQ